MNKLIPISVGSALACLVAAYVFLFNFDGLPGLTRDPAVLGQLGDYIGGLLNPALSFISVVLLIKSLSLQNNANAVLVSQLKEAKKTEKLKSFESQLFNMIEAQRRSFESLSYKPGMLRRTCFAEDAVEAIEAEVFKVREAGASAADIRQLLESIDSRDQLYGATRKFYIMIKTIADCLSDDHGFNSQDRARHMVSVINFTDFALIRLLMLAIQFFDYPSCDYLKQSKEFTDVLGKLGLSVDLY